MNDALISYLETFITESRRNLFNRIITHRTKYITVALEDIYQSHNASAVLRTCDCFGIQNVHIIENKNPYQLNKEVTLGADKWLTLKKYRSTKNNTLKAIRELRKSGYRIIATTPHKDDVALQDFNLSAGKVALFFGTELQGLTNDVLENADELMKIPIYGFTESFNISVSAAIILHQLTIKLHLSDIDWHLTPEEIYEVKRTWLKKSIKKSDLIEKEFLSNPINNHNIK